MMKKWWIGLIVLAVLGFAGYKIGMNYASEKMIDEVAKQVLTKEEMNTLLNDPEIQKTIQEQGGAQMLDELKANAGTPAASPDPAPSSQDAKADAEKAQGASGSSTQAAPSPQGSGEDKKMRFASKEEALQFILTKFTMSELKELASKASGGLNGEEKAEIKSALHERLTAEEYEALKVIGIIEMSKRSKQ